jgi:opacity protein-like surface antigen
MNNAATALIVAALSAGGCASVAQAQSGAATGSIIPRSAMFLGVGASLNATSFPNQYLYAQGVSNIFQNGAQVAYGSAGGAINPSFEPDLDVSPTAQLGYFRHFEGSDWLWGAKFSYNYLDAKATNEIVRVPQAGSFTSANSDTFSGNVVIRSYETRIKNQMALMLFVGRSFDRILVYAGAGPSLARTQSNLNGMIGFAALNGVHDNITGTPADFSSAQWVFGGAATVGATYFVTSEWFIDAGYTYTATKNPKARFAGYFASSSQGYDDTGIISGNYSGSFHTQEFKISLNRAF